MSRKTYTPEQIILKLRETEVSRIYGGEFCTLSDSERFFSFRRDGETGRVASLIWMNSEPNIKREGCQ